VRAQRLVDDPDGAVWYGARRIFAFALMIRGGIPTGQAEHYLLKRAWHADAAARLRLAPEDLASELISTMTASGTLVVRDGRLHAAAAHAPANSSVLRLPFPGSWWRYPRR
jgi:hypothetical protein